MNYIHGHNTREVVSPTNDPFNEAMARNMTDAELHRYAECSANVRAEIILDDYNEELKSECLELSNLVTDLEAEIYALREE